MRMAFVYKADPDRGRQWADVFRREAPHIDFRLWPDIGDAADVRFLAAWEPPADLQSRFENLQVLFSTGAGVDQFDFSMLPPQLPVVRMVEPGIVQGMVEYVTHAVLDLHRDMPAYRRAQSQGQWRPLPVRPARERRVGVLGLGSLAQAVLAKLVAFDFDCAGWSRSRHDIAGVRCYAGNDELDTLLADSEILVCLLPLTDATRGVLNAALFAKLPPGASRARRHRSRAPAARPSIVGPSQGAYHAAHREHDAAPDGSTRSDRKPAPPCARRSARRAGRPHTRLLRQRSRTMCCRGCDNEMKRGAQGRNQHASITAPL
jgi:glyoxylate/hydroxypyruvate reductase A